MISDVLSDLHAEMERSMALIREYQRECPESYDDSRDKIDTVVAIVEATMPLINTLRVYFDTPPKDLV